MLVAIGSIINKDSLIDGIIKLEKINNQLIHKNDVQW